RANGGFISSAIRAEPLFISSRSGISISVAVCPLSYPITRFRQRHRCKGVQNSSISGLNAPAIQVVYASSRMAAWGSELGIGGSLAAPPLAHHRTYGSVYGGSRS